jgi:hypothetical protein
VPSGKAVFSVGGWDDERNDPDVPVATVSIADLGDRTELILQCPVEETDVAEHANRWSSALDRLAGLVTQG